MAWKRAGEDDELERVTFPWAPSLTDLLGQSAAAAPWHMTVTWRFTEQEAIPVAIEVHSNSGPITAQMWRTIRVQEVIDTSRRRLKALHIDLRPVAPELTPVLSFEEEPKRRPGRPRHYSDEFLAEVAEVYLDAVAHHSRRPVREVADHFTARGLSAKDAKNWVGQARQRGFIPGKEGPRDH